MHPVIEASQAPPSGARVALSDVLLTLAFIAMYYVQLVHHQMWRDELNAWGIAVASTSIPSLFHHIHYEGHPWLWYVLLWIPSRFTASPIALKVIQGMVGTGIYLVIGLASPFSIREKLLIFLSYYVSFEYTVLSRMYGMVLLLTLIYVWRRCLYPQRVLGNAVLLGLIASTDLIGIIITGGLVCEYAYTLWSRRRAEQWPQVREMRLAALVYGLITVFSIWSLKPTSDVSWRTTKHPFHDPGNLKHLFDMLVTYTMLPFFSINLQWHHWETWWNADYDLHRRLFILFFPVVLLSIYLTFRRWPNLLIAIGVTLLGATAFGHLVYSYGSQRHYGMLFVEFLGALWILRTRVPRLAMPALLLLAVSAASGTVARVKEWETPFSNAEAASGWLQQHHLEKAPLSGYTDTSIVTIAELNERSIYMPECQCSDTFLLFGSRRDHFKKEDLPDRIAGAFSALHSNDIVFVDIVAVRPELIAALAARNISIQPLSQFIGAQAMEEDYYLYELHRQTP